MATYTCTVHMKVQHFDDRCSCSLSTCPGLGDRSAVVEHLLGTAYRLYNQGLKVYERAPAETGEVGVRRRRLRSVSCTIRSHVNALSIESNAPSVLASTFLVSNRRRTRVSSSSASMSVEDSDTMDDPVDDDFSESSEPLSVRAWEAIGKGIAASGCAERMVEAMADMKGSSGSSLSCATRALSSAACRLWRNPQKTNDKSRRLGPLTTMMRLNRRSVCERRLVANDRRSSACINHQLRSDMVNAENTYVVHTALDTREVSSGRSDYLARCIQQLLLRGPDMCVPWGG